MSTRHLLTAVCAAWVAVGGSARAQDAAPPEARSYWVYAAAESADEVYRVRFDAGVAPRLVVEEVVEVGYQPTEIEGPHGLTVAPDGRHWYLSMAHGKPYGTLYKYTTADDALVGQCELGLFPATMQISEATGLLYCVNFDLHGDMSPSSVSVVDPDGMVELRRVTTGPMPHGSRIAPDGLRHYSCAMMSDQLFELDTVDFSVRRVLDLVEKEEAAAEATPPESAAADDDAQKPAPAGRGHGHGRPHGGSKWAKRGRRAASGRGAEGMATMQAMHGVAKPTWVYPHPARDVVYVCLNGMAQVVEVDLESWTITRRFETAAGPYNVEVTPDGTRMVVSYKSAGAVGIWDLVSGREIARVPSTRRVTHGVATSPDSRYAFVTNEGVGAERGTLDVFDVRDGSRVGSVALGLQMGGIAFWKVGETPGRE